MIDRVQLISTVYAQNAMGVNVATERTVTIWAEVQSVSRTEFFEAGRSGISPSLTLVTPRVNYAGQQIAVVGGVRYAIYRTYLPADSDVIELHLEQRAGVTHG